MGFRMLYDAKVNHYEPATPRCPRRDDIRRYSAAYRRDRLSPTVSAMLANSNRNRLAAQVQDITIDELETRMAEKGLTARDHIEHF